MENKPQKDNSKITLAVVLIAVGFLWILKKIGVDLNFFPDIINPIRNAFHSLPGFIFSWPMVLVIVGLIMIAGKRSSGVVLIIVGGVFLIPKIFEIGGISGTLFLPVLLIAIGVGLIVKHSMANNPN